MAEPKGEQSSFSIVRKYERMLKAKTDQIKVLEKNLEREKKISKQCRIAIAKKDNEINVLKRRALELEEDRSSHI